jgi:hypothetical protein
MTRAALALCLVAAVTGVACASDPAPEPERPLRAADSASGIVVTEDDRSLPRGCRPAEVAGLLRGLFDALNSGDRAAAASRVIDTEMLAQLERSADGRPLRLRAVIVGLGNGLGQIEFRAAGRLIGKGAVDCQTRKLVAIGLGRERTRMAPLCDRVTVDAGASVGCVRHWS